ncbi:ATP-binding cassette domain-containing protein [Streptomyces clavuligerus]|uniref:AAA ATPase n=1 Tax=Streptomyces clavuligerus TaxID=1901 RepID=B5GRA0_STRCL|nr:ATP-binding cassette domain-containing protein [Streptomyces clavuligerus]EDY48846.1 AAA ATPase [Streptomyces clavuligerus]EFG03952.1 AAA ATPase [Streptomyces clavuligerus]MBY6307547.1 ATP-binding cassette domain-containing protein [Streptomyces clavuligerus]QCS09896.1 ABC transporter [Streptomyces clavuligerus]QPJ98058.1 ATP-binding cassette domain-containing protein [Streptomyces clavuligerus]
MFVDRVFVPHGLAPDRAERARWPFTVPAVAQLLNEGLTFMRPVTFLVGDNGSGKSTLVEAIAESFKLDAYGGRLARVHGRPDPTRTPLGEVLRADTTRAGARMLAGPRRSKKGFFLRAETAFDMTENLGGVPGYWDEDTSAMSHGEGFLTMFRAMFDAPGFYVMDEPEAALSFTACLQLVGLMHQLGERSAQVVCATHSPILAATPGADVIEVGDHGFRRTAWEDLELVDHWRRYLGNPNAYLRHIVP